MAVYGQNAAFSLTPGVVPPACTSMTVAGISASGYETVNPPVNAIDNSLSTRWSNYGIGSWIMADLGQQAAVCSIEVSWYKGDVRVNDFVVTVSSDGVKYTTAFAGKSSGTTTSAEKYIFSKPIVARYVKITVNGSTGTLWASIAELDYNGYKATAYTVQAGDSLSKIGSKFGTPWQDIAAANKIVEPYRIFVGQNLIVPLSAGECPDGMIRDTSDNICYVGSTGWKITGYYLPLESDFTSTSLQSYYVKGTRSDGTYDYISDDGVKFYLKQFRKGFIDQINIQGGGVTVDNRVLQSWGKDYIYPGGIKTKFYHYEACALTSSGVCLTPSPNSLNEPLVIIAVTTPDEKGLTDTDMEVGVIKHGTLVKILNIKETWNTKTYWAADSGGWSDKHIDVFTGYGELAKQEAYRITKTDYSGSVVVMGSKPVR